MNKKFKVLLLLSLVFLIGCSPDSTDIDDQDVSVEEVVELTTLITLSDSEGGELLSEVVPFEEGDTLLEIMHKNFEVVEEDGFISSIEGYSQDPDENIWLVYELNEEMSVESAEDLELDDEDVVSWKLEQF